MTAAALDRFAEAFNRRELQGVSETLAEDAVAQVVGSPFPQEKGRAMIAETSLPYLFDSDVSASVVTVEEAPGLVLRTHHGRGPVDVLIAVALSGSEITRLDYITAPHQPYRFAAICKSLGLPANPS